MFRSLYRVAANVLQVGVVRIFGEGFLGKTNAYLEIRTLKFTRLPTCC